MPLIKQAGLLPAQTGDLDWHLQLERLQAGSVDERRAAARALAAEPAAVPALAAALSEAADPRLREAIFTSLASQDSPASFAAVLRHLRSDDAELRCLALDAMKLMPQQAASHLPSLLDDTDPDIRLLACELGRQIPPDTAAPLLAGLLTAEPQVNVCAAAIEVLAEIASPAELSSLSACAARFPAEVFLNFSVEIARDEIRARAGS
jgi:HEAT repeat protein